MRSAPFRIILHVLLPLFIGLIIYIIARPESWLSHKLLTSFPTNWRYKGDIKNAPMYLQVIFNSGPDFCWSYSFSSALFLWKFYSGFSIPFFFWIVLVILLSSEVIQLFFPAKFVFDWVDMFAATLAVSLSFCLNNKLP